MDIDTLKELLKEFKFIPVIETESTYLEICQYPRRRFEEICSRLLCFFFDPHKEHKLNNLFISSLMQLLGSSIHYDYKQIEIVTEENADGKRIDLLIKCPDFVICIENKTTSSLNNPLNVYKEHLAKFSVEKRFKIVLSVFDVTRPKEVKWMKQNGFIPYTYSQFFEVIKSNIGQYISGCNQKYLTHLSDFIQTMDNMKISTYSNPDLVNYIFENEQDIKKLISAYNQHKTELLNLHKGKISELKEEISKRTEVKWWAYQGYGLGYNNFKHDHDPIGIESKFKASKDNPFDKFEICITTWDIKKFLPYKDEALKYPNEEIEVKIKDNRYFLRLKPINGNDTEAIIEKLVECYEFVKEITKEE